jgi:hypothetical protein
MQKYKDIFTIFSLFISFSVLFYNFTLKSDVDFRLFLTISTFLFAIFSGFFIARQGTRYGMIRDLLIRFDGNMSFIYRASGHFGEAQKEVAGILRKHYAPILELKAWHYPFTHKTTTLTDLHSFCQKVVGEKTLASLQSTVLAQIITSLRECQGLRKNMIALHEERVPTSQWFILILLTLVILISLLIIPSQFEFFSSLLKGVFGSLLVFVLIFLRRLDRLEFFDGIIGETSARDVLNIIEGKR